MTFCDSLLRWNDGCADSGTSQYAATSTPILEALSAIVTDNEDNRIPNISVTFTIDEGDAVFSNNQQTLTLVTDKYGVAAARPVMGTTPGTVRISARALDGLNGPNGGSIQSGASYQISVLPQQDGPTRFTGKVMDHTGTPLPGVRISIVRTNLIVTTDTEGNFSFTDQVPPGKIDLFIDGRTANLNNKQYPSLHFEALAVRGQNNTLPHAIYLPPLLTSAVKIVGGNQDVTLTIPGFEGFEMKVKANSVTFPDGSKIGPLVVSPVLQDKLPMVPPGGYAGFMAPAWTIQPSGTRFDPPIEVKIPNSLDLKPGEGREIYQWDHDLATFLPMGRATVSEDGALLVTDDGSGVTKAGWGGTPRPPPPPKCAIPAVCDPKKCLEDGGNCTCKDSLNKCKEGAEIKGQWSVPDGFIEQITKKIDTFSKLNPAFSLSLKAKASGTFDATIKDTCCADLSCTDAPKKSTTVTGTIGASATVSLELGPGFIQKIERVVAKFGTAQSFGYVASLQVTDILPKVTATLGSSSISVSGKSETCLTRDACLEGTFSSSVGIGAKWRPLASAGLYVKKNDSLPTFKPDGSLDSDNLQFLVTGKIEFGGEIKADGLAVKVVGSFGDTCSKNGQVMATIKQGGVKASWKAEFSAATVGLGSLTFKWGDEVELFAPLELQPF